MSDSANGQPLNFLGLHIVLGKIKVLNFYFMVLWLSKIYFVHPYLGKILILTNILQTGLKPPTRKMVASGTKPQGVGCEQRPCNWSKWTLNLGCPWYFVNGI